MSLALAEVLEFCVTLAEVLEFYVSLAGVLALVVFLALAEVPGMGSSPDGVLESGVTLAGVLGSVLSLAARLTWALFLMALPLEWTQECSKAARVSKRGRRVVQSGVRNGRTTAPPCGKPRVLELGGDLPELLELVLSLAFRLASMLLLLALSFEWPRDCRQAARVWKRGQGAVRIGVRNGRPTGQPRGKPPSPWQDV